MPRLVTDAGRRRIWFISPALATVIFFTAQILISLIGGPSGTGVAGLAPQTPQAPRGDRVVQTIEPVDPVERTVPRGTDELLELLDQHRAIRFRPASARTTQAGAGALGGLGAAHP